MLLGALLAAMSLGATQADGSAQAADPARSPTVPPVVELALERRLADSLELSVGDTVRFGASAGGLDRLGVVAAIYQPPPDPATILRRDYRVRLHLPDLADLTGRPDRIDRIAVRIAPGADPDSVAARLNQTAFGFRAYPSAALASESSRTFAVVSRFHRAIAVITTVASAVFLLCIMLLKVEERRLDAAVMRFIGVRRRTIFGALLLEAAAIAVVGSAMGIVIARVAGAITNRYYQRVFETELIFSLLTPGIVAFGVGLSLLLGLAAGAAAAARLVQTSPMTLWRRG
jgi:putative ABC transport system permease protein